MNPIAIIGMAGRFPGAPSVAEFWRNQLDGVESISHLSVEELEIADPVATSSQPAYVRSRGLIEDADLFDAAFFSMLPREAERTDPQQRLFLECCWQTLESAGYDPNAYRGAIGVFAGTSYSSYFLSRICEQPGFRERYASEFQTGNYGEMVGNHPDFLATRVAYKLDLRGPAFTLSAGCSTSLIAVCQAAQSLLAGQCDMALAGATSITLPQKRGYLHQPGGMGSADGHCRTFDADAQGTVFGGGVAAVLLKRLDDAVRDGDTVHAVMRGFAMNNDGAAKIGYTAPGVEGQAQVIAAAHRHAGIDAATIGYVEAHGTATPLGDPIELAALARAFKSSAAHTGAKTCVLGTAKANVGHLDVAAGITGLIHATHIVREGLLPATLHFARPTERFDWAANPFRVNTELAAWNPSSFPRRAGISAFGVGGTNVHVVLEEAPPNLDADPARAEAPARTEHLLLVSAKTPGALRQARENLAAHLRQTPDVNLADAAYTLQVGRRVFAYRDAVVASDAAAAAEALSSPGLQPCEAIDGKPDLPGSEVSEMCFLFPGQGAQQPNMGRALYEREPVYRGAVDRCAAFLHPALGLSLVEILYPEQRTGEADHRLMQTSLAQPAIFVTEYALATLWRSWGIRPSAMIGHSVGEYVAACLAGVLTLEDALRLIAVRGQLMQELAPGVMLSVRMAESELAPILEDASLAAVNSLSLCVAAGSEEQVAALEARLTRRNVAHRRLHTSHAFHSSMMDPILERFADEVSKVPLHAPSIPYMSGLTGNWITAEQATSATYWATHLRRTVQFSTAVQRLSADGKAHLLLEVGPGSTLSTLARQQIAPQPRVCTSLGAATGTPDEMKAMLQTLGQLWVAGVSPDWQDFRAGTRRKRIPLPTYPFERKRFWIDLPSAPTPATQQAATVKSVPVSNAEPVRLPEIPPLISNSIQPDRLASLRAGLVAIFQDLSGLVIPETAAHASFLDLGLDSLFLTQATQAVQKQYGVKVTFRQLMSSLDSIEALAAHLDCALPVETPAPPTAAAPPPAPSITTTAPAIDVAPPSPVHAQPAESIPNMQRLFQQQTEAMQQLFAQQLASLQLASSTSPQIAPPLGTAPLPATAASAIAAPAAVPGTPAERELKGYSPFKPVQKNSEALTAKQQECLQAFTARYTSRTAGSKRSTQQQRAALADPRVVAGFRKQWKELVYPLVAVRSRGAYLWDVDGNQYVDILNGFGPIMLGHRPAFVQRAIEEQLRLGFEIGPQTPLAGEVAQMICAMTGNERATFCNTGSEAVTAALRIARTVTGRDKVVFFAGDYHGMFDEVLAKGFWKDGEPCAVPAAPGIPRAKSENVVVLEYGADQSLAWIRAHAEELAAVMVEPVQSRHPALQPIEFLREIRSITETSGTCFIFDEVVTGFRTHPGGCQALFDIRADLVTYGKVLAGGMPIGVLCGKAQYMDALDGGMWEYGDESFPEAGVTFFAGTFVRHPLTMAACRAMLKHLVAEGPALQQALAAKTATLVATLSELLVRHGVPARIETFSSIFYLSFAPECRFGTLFYYFLRDKGVHLLEGFPCFLTTAHTQADLAWIVRAFSETIAEMQAGDLLPVADLQDSTVSAPAPSRHATEPPAVPGHGPVKTFPLTEAQREVWLAAQVSDEASCAFNESFTLRLAGPLDEPRLRASVQQLVDRHDSLRATVSASGELSRVSHELALPIKSLDLAQLPASQREEQLAALAAAEARLPFDLEAGPLLRIHLVRLAGEECALLVTSHHIVCDGWSVNVLLDELARLYKGEMLPPALSFGEYAAAERSAAVQEGSAHNKAQSYWLSRFAEPATPLDLPVDRPRPAVKSYAGATYRTRWSAETTRLLRGAGAAQGCTLFVTLLSGFTALLSRLCTQRDIVVGIPTAGQSLLDESGLVGHAVNFLPIRTQLRPEETFRELLKQTQRTLLDAYDHQTYTYGTMVRALKIRKDVSRLPLIEVQFNLEKIGNGLRFGDLRAQVDANPKASVNFDLFLNIVDTGDGLLLDCDYNTDLFDKETITRWLEHYQALLRSGAANAAGRVDRLELVASDVARRMQGATGDNAGRRSDTRALSALQLFEAQCERTPHAVAVLSSGQSLSYAELNRQAGQIAAHLNGMGVRPGDLVGIASERGIAMLEALLGIWKIGATYVPLDPSYPQQRLDMILADTLVPVLITDTRSAEKFRDAEMQLVFLDRDRAVIDRAPVFRPSAAADLDRLAYVIFTSGSTGKPKGVEVTHRNLANFLQSMQREPGMAAADKLLAVTTLSFDIAALELYLPLISGAQVQIATREEATDARQLRRLLQEEAITVLQATPATWRMLLESGWTGLSSRSPTSAGALPGPVATVGRGAAPGLKMLCGGEALSRELAQSLLPCGASLWNMYGPTETTVWSAVGRVFSADKPIAIGPAIANTHLYVLDAHRQPQPIGVPGELYIGGAGVARGYYKRPDLTEERFVVEPCAGPGRIYRTGDLVRSKPDGTLEFLGRIDHQVKVNGFRIELGEIESVLGKHPKVRDLVVVAREDQPGEKRLVAYLVTDGTPPPVGELRAAVGRALPDFMVPSIFIFLPALPQTPNGKIDRARLPVPGAHHLQRQPSSAPRPGMEVTLARICAEVLQLDEVDPEESLFDLGADSIHLFQIIARARALALELSPQQIMRLQTVRALAANLEAASAPTSLPQIKPVPRAEYRVSLPAVEVRNGATHS